MKKNPSSRASPDKKSSDKKKKRPQAVGKLNKWDKRFLELAKFISNWSKDPGCKVGAVITNNKNEIVSVGYNGFSRKVKDLKKRLNNRDIKLLFTIHAEINAIIFSGNKNLKNTTLYTYPFSCCSNCAAVVSQCGIKKVVAPDLVPSRWKTSLNVAKKIFNETGVKHLLVNFS